MTNPHQEKSVLVNLRFSMSWTLYIMVWWDHGKFYELAVVSQTYFSKSFLKSRNIYRIHQMVSRIFCNYESFILIFRKTEFVYLFLCTANVNNNIHFQKIIYRLVVPKLVNYLMNSIYIFFSRWFRQNTPWSCSK